MDNISLSKELLDELKISAKRWFIAFIIMVVVEVLTIGGFLWYISLPIDETAYYEQEAEQEDGENNTITQKIGEKE